ncbi:GntR family transcriptional regulator [Flavobacterium commune]|uniref:GntR family transcriptional regulator n=1 Tax=Flavobacterium commune TaxID=1306519 RepID=A0A1D9P887_9FLAO|nr:GntR family transcriptional regulator [Flavobacterium commune]AOZ98776.1 GntR family transcriptional regulator [Flavobacterium commune]
MEKKFTFKINHDSDIPKYQQLVNSINNAIAENILGKGEQLPSVNSICQKNQLSRDTVFKAYSILKEQKLIDSVPNKGYFVAGETRKVLLVLDTFKAYKEVLYHSFVDNLAENIIVDVQFHHYNIDNFKNIINNSIGKYYKYVVMNFDDKEVASTLTSISNEKLLLIDWNIHSKSKNNFVFQDFGKAFYDALKQGENLFKKYEQVIFIYPPFTYHPKETLEYFKKFCSDFNLKHKIIYKLNDFYLQKNTAYISVSDRILGMFLEQCREKNFEPGKDIGFLSYNETPMKKFIYKGISVVTTDFNQLGIKAAEFVSKDEPMKIYIPTNLIKRESL